MITYLVTYKQEKGTEKLSKIEAENYRYASKRAEEVIAFINEKLGKNNKLGSIIPLHAVEDWTND